ncbi:hypothetical protein ACFWA9_22710 [Kitasatospora sp. NPDC059973]|uniref:hypothetical protein n=1 Tax=Kitasatospora sp. NPDC059973 TaxID=3347020 RepID=UPI003684E31B
MVEDPTRHQLLHRFATWHQLRRLRAKAEAGPLGRSPTSEARQQITQADAFLTWLTGQNRTLDQCQQADLDAWHADNYATRRPAQPFLRWCMDKGAMPRLVLPPHVIKQDQAPMHQHRRLAILHRVLHDEALPLRTRTAAALVLLYAQPVSRIVRLTIADVADDGDALTIRLGDPRRHCPHPSPISCAPTWRNSPASPTPAVAARPGSFLVDSPDNR